MFSLLRFSCSVSQAAIFSTSARWYNYRHSSNAFNVANVLLKNKLSPKNVFLAVGENNAYDVRNPYPGKIYIDNEKKFDVYVTPNISDDNVDKRSFRNVLLRGPVSNDVSTIHTIKHGKMLLYITGHGGDEFLKFREVDQIKAKEFAEIIDDMKRVLKFDELLIILDTCEAISMFNYIKTDGVTVIASSGMYEKSISTHYDSEYHVPLCDLFTYQMCNAIRKMSPNASLSDLIKKLMSDGIHPIPIIKQFGCKNRIEKMKIRDWFYPD